MFGRSPYRRSRGMYGPEMSHPAHGGLSAWQRSMLEPEAWHGGWARGRNDAGYAEEYRVSPRYRRVDFPEGEWGAGAESAPRAQPEERFDYAAEYAREHPEAAHRLARERARYNYWLNNRPRSIWEEQRRFAHGPPARHYDDEYYDGRGNPLV